MTYLLLDIRINLELKITTIHLLIKYEKSLIYIFFHYLCTYSINNWNL